MAEAVAALLLAAGSGARTGAPKAWLAWQGRPLLAHLVAQMAPFATTILVGVAEQDCARAADLLRGTGARVAAGGASRQATVAILVEAASEPMLLLHEVARPFTPPALFAAVLAAADEAGAAAPALQLERRDAVGLARDGWLGESLPRDAVVSLQTPQAYRRAILADICRRAAAEGWEDAPTASLCRRAGHPLKLVAGDPANRKITYPEDLALLA